MTNLTAILISFLYVFIVLGVAELLRKLLNLPVEFTRKVVHIGVGMWAWGTAALFTDKWAALICPASFIILNTISYKRGIFLAMESNDRSNLGTIYFPIAFVIIILLIFDFSTSMMVAALMPMTWGDSFAAIVGKRLGTHRYTPSGTTKTVEGSITMFVLSFISVFSVFVAFELLDNAGLVWAAAFAAVTALCATVIEAISPKGLDNLTVPAISMLALWLMTALYRGSLP
jgi:phytol kinase